MRGKHFARLTIAALGGLALAGIVIFAGGPNLFLPPLPPPPIIEAPRGDLPAGIVAFEERVQTAIGYQAVGSGFLLELPNGDVIGVTTAHSLGKDNFAPVAFVIAGGETVVATFNHLYAPLGTPKSGHNVSIDYVLMQPDAPPDRAIVLRPDSRGAPQPGERISLYSGRGDARGGQRVLHGAVESIDANGVWIRMDGWFDPGGMSGSPVFSQHTGQVVGMIVAVSPRIGTVVIGVNPIGVILDKASMK